MLETSQAIFRGIAGYNCRIDGADRNAGEPIRLVSCFRQGLIDTGLISAKRAAAFDQIPTIAEAGFAGFDVNPWFGLLAPSRTPAAVVAKINADVIPLLRSKEVAEKFAAQGAEPYLTSPSEFTRVLRADIQKWGEVVKASGAHID